MSGVSIVGGLKSLSTLGYFVAILAAGLAAFVHVGAKPLLGSGVETTGLSPITLAFVIYVINGLFFTPFVKNSGTIKNIGKRNLFFLMLIGMAEVVGLITYFFGLKDTTATHASILNNSEMIFSIFIAITIFRERLRKKELTPFSMIIVGIIVLPIGYDLYNNNAIFNNFVIGDLLILLSGLFFALDINISKYVSDRVDSKRITQLTSFAAGGFALCMIVILQIPFNVDVSNLPGIAITGIVGTGISTFFFILSLRLIGTVRTIMIYSTSFIFGIMFSAIFLQETTSLANIFSIILVLGGVYMLRNRLCSENKTEKPKLRLEINT